MESFGASCAHTQQPRLHLGVHKGIMGSQLDYSKRGIAWPLRLMAKLILSSRTCMLQHAKASPPPPRVGEIRRSCQKPKLWVQH